uniref:Uncharacterized protein n=1 Tax=Schizaphis graminum TaxID=13262 RepID=A0A2S2PSN7_SCHGA
MVLESRKNQLVNYLIRLYIIYVKKIKYYNKYLIEDTFWPSKNGKIHGFCDLGDIAHDEGVGQWWLISFNCREGKNISRRYKSFQTVVNIENNFGEVFVSSIWCIYCSIQYL